MEDWCQRGRLMLAGILVLACAVGCFLPGCMQARSGGEEAIRHTVAPLPDLVGNWCITRMDVDVSPTVLGSAAEIDVHSQLSGPSQFTILSDGMISGWGTVEYKFEVSGVIISTALSELGLVLPVDSRASGTGQRSFTVTGRADFQQ